MVFFSFKTWIMDVDIMAPNMNWSHGRCLIQTIKIAIIIKKNVANTLPWLIIALNVAYAES
jgi:hypothetical protein